MNSECSAFHTAIFDAICASVNLTEEEGINLIHEAYAEPENVPRPPRNRNVIYWTVLQDPSPDPVSAVYSAAAAAPGTHIPTVCTTLKYQLVIVCYGPDCEEYARRIRHMFYLDGRFFPRQILRNAGIFPVPDPPQPQLLHEEEGSLWRKRADLTIRLRVRDEQTAQVRNAITTAPAVLIRRDTNA